MATIFDILLEIKEGRGFKLPEWPNYKYNKEFIVFDLKDLMREDWELEPLKKEVKLFQAVYKIKHVENGKTKFFYAMSEILYENKEQAETFKPGFNFKCEVELIELIPVNLSTPIYEVIE